MDVSVCHAQQERWIAQHQMDIGQLCSILAACMSTNPEQRKAGETTLEQV